HRRAGVLGMAGGEPAEIGPRRCASPHGPWPATAPQREIRKVADISSPEGAVVSKPLPGCRRRALLAPVELEHERVAIALLAFPSHELIRFARRVDHAASA